MEIIISKGLEMNSANPKNRSRKRGKYQKRYYIEKDKADQWGKKYSNSFGARRALIYNIYNRFSERFHMDKTLLKI